MGKNEFCDGTVDSEKGMEGGRGRSSPVPVLVLCPRQLPALSKSNSRHICACILVLLCIHCLIAVLCLLNTFHCMFD